MNVTWKQYTPFPTHRQLRVLAMARVQVNADLERQPGRSLVNLGKAELGTTQLRAEALSGVCVLELTPITRAPIAPNPRGELGRFRCLGYPRVT